MPLSHDPFLAEQADALGSELSVSRHPGSTPGERTSRFDRYGPLAQLLAEHPALNRQVEGSTPSRSTNSDSDDSGLVAQGSSIRLLTGRRGFDSLRAQLMRLRLAAGHRALTARTQVRNLEPQPTCFQCHVNSAARVLACPARSHGFESRTWRHFQRTDSSVGRAPG